MQLKIEKIAQKDFIEVAGLIKKEFPYISSHNQKIESRLARPDIFIFKATKNSEIIGFIDLSLFEGKGIVNGFAIKEKFRKQGFGQELLEFGANFLKEIGAQEITLLVKKENFVAKKIYRKAGFKFVKVHAKKIDGSIVEEMELKKPLREFTPHTWSI